MADDTVRVGKAVGTAWTFAVDVGIREGIFERYGLEVQSASFGGDAKLQQALASFGVDFGLGSGPAMAFAVKGAPISRSRLSPTSRATCGSVGAQLADRDGRRLKGKLLAISTTGRSPNGW